MNGKMNIAFEMAKYVRNNYFKNLSNADKLKLFDELIVNGFYVNKKEGYVYGIEFFNWLQEEKDEKILNTLNDDKRYINNFKF